MAAGDIHLADPIDTSVHHEIDSTVHSYCVYKPVWSPVIEQLVLSKEKACWPIHTLNLQYLAVMQTSQPSLVMALCMCSH